MADESPGLHPGGGITATGAREHGAEGAEADVEHQLDEAATTDATEPSSQDTEEPRYSETSTTKLPTRTHRAYEKPVVIKGLIAGGIIATVLGMVAAWLGHSAYQARELQRNREMSVQAARQGALNLTTIDYARVQDDVTRILESSTGDFHDEFQSRAPAFVDFIKSAQSKSQGTIKDAGLESEDGDQTSVLVALSVSTSSVGAAEQTPGSWRMRVTVKHMDDGSVKVSNVEFVP